MASNETIRLGLIGAGGIFQQRHFPGLRGLPGVELVAVCNRSGASSRRVADQWGVARVEADWRAVVEAGDVDAVMIGTWPYLHRELSVAALGAGKHVFCQARMAGTLADAQAMLDAADARPDLVSVICPPPHRMPYEPALKAMLDAGELGELRAASLACVDGSNLGPLHWRERVEFSGQQIMQVGIWAEALHAWLGPYDTLHASLATPIASKPDPTHGDAPYPIAIPQLASIHGTLASGLPIAEHHSGVSPAEPVNALTIVGEKKTVRVRIVGGHMRLDLADHADSGNAGGGDSGSRFVELDPPAELQNPWRVEADFIDAVRAARRGDDWRALPTTSPGFAEGLAYMHKIDAIHRSAATGDAVTLG